MKDEDTFDLPRYRLPRRDAGAAAIPVVDGDVEAAAKLLSRYEPGVRLVLADPRTPPDVAAAGHAFLAFEAGASPLGAAAVVCAMTAGNESHGLPSARADETAGFADYWRHHQGLPFAAAAVTELGALDTAYSGAGIVRRHTNLDMNPVAHAWTLELAFRVRRVLAGAPGEEYAATVAALASRRGVGAGQDALISLMVPDQTAWADEVMDTVKDLVRPGTKAMLLTVAGSPERARQMKYSVDTSTAVRHPETLHTLVATVGSATAPLLARWADGARRSEDARQLFGLIAAIPTDEAVSLLAGRTGSRAALTALRAAAARFPRRAMRVLAERGETELLHQHVVTYLDLADEVAGELTASGAARLAGLAGRLRANAAAVAPDDAVPPVLANPPWQAPVRPKLPVVAGLRCGDEAYVDWRPGEREAYAGGYSSMFTPADGWEAFAWRIGTGTAVTYREVAFFVEAAEGTARPLLDGWAPQHLHRGHEWGRHILARFGVAAVPMLMAAAQRSLTIVPILEPVGSAELAVLMAGWYARKPDLRQVVLRWVARHADLAARALIPPAVGRAGLRRTQAEILIGAAAAYGGLAETIRAVAKDYGERAAEVIDGLLAIDPLSLIPQRVPRLPSWADPRLLPPVALRDGRGTLPPAAAANLVTMLALSRIATPHGGIERVRAACEADSLAAFGWELFQQWQRGKSPTRTNWAFEALGLVGDDETVRRLLPVIREWPQGGSGGARAALGLEVVAAIGTDFALAQLDGIAQKGKFLALRQCASALFAGAARRRGLTADELADQLVTALGLDPDGTLAIEYERRGFRAGFDVRLRPYAIDASGKRLKTVPKPVTAADEQAFRQFAGLKKDVRAFVAHQVRRLEQAMVGERRWPVAEFRRLFIEHPLLWHVTRRLVWVRETAAGPQALRVAEDRTYADLNDEPVELGGDDRIGVAHPLHLGGDLAVWAGTFADYEILQPFDQLGRAVHAPEAIRVIGRETTSGRVLALESRGWWRATGWPHHLKREFPGRRIACLTIEPGVFSGTFQPAEVQTITQARIEQPGPDLTFGEADPVVVSEILRDLDEVLG